jgi:ribosome recycling factor
MDLLLKAWAPLTDQLAEALLGLRPRLKQPQVALQIPLVSDEAAVALLKNYRGFLRDLRLESELRSIRDDLVASLDQALYRCTLA